MSRDIDLAPAVDHDQILSIATEGRYSEATPFGIDTRPLMGDRAPQTEEEMREFKNRVNKAPYVQTFFISPDETATVVTATFIERLLDYGRHRNMFRNWQNVSVMTIMKSMLPVLPF